jgi:uncharacterized membrane protein YcaP (DUF421 family)
MLLNINWEKVFLPSVSPLEIFIRGTITYLVVFLLLRFQKRELGTLSTNDLLVLVLLADASQNGMAGNYESITDGILLIVIIMLWNLLLNWLGYNFSFFERILKPPKLLLVKEGKMIRRNMKQELVTEQELIGELRKNGINDISDVHEAFMENDGTISVISLNDFEKTKKKKKRKAT